LEDEGNQNQKLMSERTTADNKIKGLEEQMTLSEDNISKVSGLVKILNSASHTVREKDLITNDSIFVISDLVQQTKKDIRESSYDFKIFSSPNCVPAGSVEALGFKDTKRVSSKFLITDFINLLAIEDGLRGKGSTAWYESYGNFMRNDLMKRLVAFVSRTTANISQKIVNCKKRYDFCAQKLAGDEFGVLDPKIANVQSMFNINLNKGEAITNKD
jgi:hypothetical protein